MKTKTARFGHRAAFRISTKLDWFGQTEKPKRRDNKEPRPYNSTKRKGLQQIAKQQTLRMHKPSPVYLNPRSVTFSSFGSYSKVNPKKNRKTQCKPCEIRSSSHRVYLSSIVTSVSTLLPRYQLSCYRAHHLTPKLELQSHVTKNNSPMRLTDLALQHPQGDLNFP